MNILVEGLDGLLFRNGTLEPGDFGRVLFYFAKMLRNYALAITGSNNLVFIDFTFSP
jgi:hypothetical protein